MDIQLGLKGVTNPDAPGSKTCINIWGMKFWPTRSLSAIGDDLQKWSDLIETNENYRKVKNLIKFYWSGGKNKNCCGQSHFCTTLWVPEAIYTFLGFLYYWGCFYVVYLTVIILGVGVVQIPTFVYYSWSCKL